MLKDEVVKYYYPGNGYNYNCAEAMLRALNDYYHLDLSRDILYASSSFGGGSGHDEMCGGIAGVLAVLGVMFSNNGKGHDSEKLNELRRRFFAEFDKVYQGSNCVYLKSNYYVPVHKCESILVNIADIVERLLEESEKEI